MKLPRGASSHLDTELPEAAVAALRASALLEGGVPASRVWRVLGREEGASARLLAISTGIDAGLSAETAIARDGGSQWLVLAAAWGLAQLSGAPIAHALRRIAEGLSDLARLRERRRVLLAGPRATIRLVALLPIAALLTGIVLGFDPVGVLLTPVGAIVAAAGGALLYAGVRWAGALAARLAEAEWVAGLECEMTWIALSGGAPPQFAIRRVADQVDRLGVAWVRLAALGQRGPVQETLRIAAAHGTPAGPMLLAAATAERARVLSELEQEAERLAVRILLPIAVCVLPSFIALGVMPVLLAVLGTLGPLNE